VIRPSPGLNCFWNGEPIQLLYRQTTLVDGDAWRVKPIFTQTAYAPERDIVIRASDRLTPIHGSHSR
jgi:hypothetical protein